MAEPILIWGGGAIGGTLAAYWARAGIDVLMVDIVAEHVEACRTVGLTIEGPIDEFTQIVPSATPDAMPAPRRPTPKKAVAAGDDPRPIEHEIGQ